MTRSSAHIQNFLPYVAARLETLAHKFVSGRIQTSQQQFAIQEHVSSPPLAIVAWMQHRQAERLP